MQTQNATTLRRGQIQDEPQSALAYWGSGFTGIGVMLAICLFAGMRF